MKRSLSRNEQVLVAYLHKTSIGAISWDLNFTITDWNPAAEAIFGYSKAEVVGKRLIGIILPEDSEKMIDDILHDLISEKGGKHSINANITKDGQSILCEWYNTILKDAEGQIVGVTSLVHDNTNIKKVYEAFKEQKEFNEKIIQTSNAIIIGLDKNHTIRIFNRGAEKITGFSSEEVMGNDWFKIFVKTDIYDEMNRVWESAWGTKFSSYINPIQVKNGDMKIISWQTTGMYDGDDVTKHLLISIGEDITERMQSEEALRTSEERFRNLVESSSDWIWEVNSEGVYTYSSLQVEKILGYKSSEIIGKTPFDFMLPEEALQIGAILKDKMKKGEPIVALENVGRHKDGHHVILETSGVATFDETGNITHYRGVDRDITERKHSESQLKKIESKLIQAQKMESIGTLAGGIAHDFNNILTGILGYAQLAEININNPAKEKEYILQITKNVQRAAELVRQILTFSRKSEYQKQPFQFYIVLKDVLKMLRSTISTTIEIKIIIDSKAQILGDPTRIHQVIMNLCTNASHAMDEKGGVLTVSLSDVEVSDPKNLKYKIVPPGNYLKFEISDTGHGMDEETLKKAFDPYFTTKEVDKGTGLGLALVQAIVDEHDGFLEVYSEMDKGTQFYIYLPIVRKETTSHNVTVKKMPLLKGDETIMFVDDEESLRQIAKIFLEDYGYKVSLFENGMEAYKEFEKNPLIFDLIVTDMNMPGMAGHHLASEVLKIRPDFPILICTGFSEDISQEQASSIGVKGLLLKPIAMQELSEKIREVLDKMKIANNG